LDDADVRAAIERDELRRLPAGETRVRPEVVRAMRARAKGPDVEEFVGRFFQMFGWWPRPDTVRYWLERRRP
ncbi:MAG: hypothetical protein ACRELB_19135, partial [Polyangiaceae bacterium]